MPVCFCRKYVLLEDVWVVVKPEMDVTDFEFANIWSQEEGINTAYV
jgi:hypothetical protein